MKHWQISPAIIAALSASIALADDFKTTAGKEYKNATVSCVEPDGIVVKTKSGITKIYFTERSKELQERFNYDPEKAAAYSAKPKCGVRASPKAARASDADGDPAGGRDTGTGGL